MVSEAYVMGSISGAYFHTVYGWEDTDHLLGHLADMKASYHQQQDKSWVQ